MDSIYVGEPALLTHNLIALSLVKLYSLFWKLYESEQNLMCMKNKAEYN